MPKSLPTPKLVLKSKRQRCTPWVKPIGFKVPIEFAELLDELAKQSGKTKNIIIMEAVELWAKQL